MRTAAAHQRVALYAYGPAGRSDAASLDGQIRRLAERVAACQGWWTVAAYGDRGGTELFARPSLARLVYDAAYGRFDLVVMDSPLRLGPDSAARRAVVARLAVYGVRVVVMERSRLRRLAAVVADLVLADLIGEAAGWEKPPA